MDYACRTRIVALASGVVLCACAETRPAASPAAEPAAAAHVAPRASTSLDRIAELEDARTTGGGELEALARASDPLVRARAARALGRMPFPEVDGEVTRALLACLLDPDANVRAEAAFALGMRADPVAGEALLLCAIEGKPVDPDPLVRARAVEAASKLPRADLRERTLAALADPDPRVRLEAAQGASRWLAKDEQLASIDRALIDHLAQETDRDVIVYTLFSLERRKAKDAAPVFSKFAVDADARTRLFAVRGLVAVLYAGPSSQLNVSELSQALQVLTEATRDPDWRVACEAVRLVGPENPFIGQPPSLPTAFSSSNPHIRFMAWSTLNDQLTKWAPADGERHGLEPRPDSLLRQLPAWTLRTASRHVVLPKKSVEPDSSMPVWAESRQAALHYMGLLSAGAFDWCPTKSDMQALIDSLTSDPSPRLPIARAGTARGIAYLPSEIAVPLLTELCRDPNAIVAEAAIEALGQHKTEEGHELLLGSLRATDNGLRLSALTALAEQPEAGDIDDLAFVFDDSQGDGTMEIRFNALRNAGKIGGDGARALCVHGLSAREPFVRKVAREELHKGWPDFAIPAVEIPASTPGKVPLAGVDFPIYERNPIVEVATSRGTMRFELFPAEAPIHVYSFLELARRGYYDGLTFHRVVPDFVIQGGDYRGDGNGGTTFRVDADVRKIYAQDADVRRMYGAGLTVPADSLRHEIGSRKFVRGSLGMPRNDDMDSGGSQFFVTHRETPHLDGRYTIFGELRDGFDVLDAIEVGDVITSVRLVEPAR